MNSESTDTTARCSVAHVSWIAHASCHRFLVLAGRVEIADIHFQAGYFCTKKKSRVVVLLSTYLQYCSHDLRFFLRKIELLSTRILESTITSFVVRRIWLSDNETMKSLIAEFYAAAQRPNIMN